MDFSEVDQQGVVYHARYLVWLDVARTEHLRHTGMSYREMELAGFRLMVSELHVKYRRSVRYDDHVRIRCWVRELGSRRVTFGYAVEFEPTGDLLATAWTVLFVIDPAGKVIRLPDQVMRRLQPIADPVAL